MDGNINLAVSQNVRRIRLQRKMTLDAAAEATGVSRSMLAQIERGDANPSVSVLWKIAMGYRVSFSALTQEQREQSVVLKADTVQPILNDDGKYVNYPAFPFEEARGFETYRILIEPTGFLQAEAHLAGAEEYITVFGGAVEIVAGESVFRVYEGDSLRFLADVRHSYRNIGEGTASLSMLIYYAN